MTYKVYLAGPITGLTYEGASDWREYANNFYRRWDEEIQGYSPLRAKDYLLERGVLSGDPDAYMDKVLSTAKGITYRDSWDVRTADLILVNLVGAEAVSIGTVLEVGMAWAHQVPVVVAMENDNIHNHAMLNTMAGWIVPDLDSALEITRAILLPNNTVVSV